MTDETISATTIINAPAEAIFAVLADPAKHAAIDGTGWVREPLDGQPLTAAGQVFRMAMYNDNVPGGHYRMANRVQVLDPPRAISWEPGMDTGDGNPQIVGHIWRYDLAPAGPSGTKVTLSYDWSAVPDSLRQRLPFPFPPFAADHLSNSLAHLAELVTGLPASRPASPCLWPGQAGWLCTWSPELPEPGAVRAPAGSQGRRRPGHPRRPSRRRRPAWPGRRGSP